MVKIFIVGGDKPGGADGCFGISHGLGLISFFDFMGGIDGALLSEARHVSNIYDLNMINSICESMRYLKINQRLVGGCWLNSSPFVSPTSKFR